MGLYKEILARFPRGSLSYVFAYGSGVKQQVGYEAVESQKNNVIDLMFCVRDPLGWHAENMDRHPSHYSGLRLLGPRFIMQYQEKLGAGIYFNTLVPLEDVGVTVKYGVVSEEKLLEDLLKWRYLYLAGRLHKPVTDIVPPTDNVKLQEALAKNLLSAFQVALLMLPANFTAFELFHTISGLSYKGDFRMIFGENKQKVRNIVEAQQQDFFDLYRPAMKQLTDYVAADFYSKDLGTKQPVIRFEQDKGTHANAYHLRHAPEQLRKRLEHNAAYRGKFIDILEQLSATHNLADIVQMSVNDIVWRSSISQSFKNIPTAGITKSIIYSYRKSLKTFANEENPADDDDDESNKTEDVERNGEQQLKQRAIEAQAEQETQTEIGQVQMHQVEEGKTPQALKTHEKSEQH